MYEYKHNVFDFSTIYLVFTSPGYLLIIRKQNKNVFETPNLNKEQINENFSHFFIFVTPSYIDCSLNL